MRKAFSHFTHHLRHQIRADLPWNYLLLWQESRQSQQLPASHDEEEVYTKIKYYPNPHVTHLITSPRMFCHSIVSYDAIHFSI